MNIGIIGAGAFGKALYSILKDNNNVKITSNRKRNIENFVPISEIWTQDVIIISISAQHIDEFLEKNFVNNNQKIIISSKGIDIKAKKRISEICFKYTHYNNIYILSGPTFSDLLIDKKPAALILAGYNNELYKEIKNNLPSFIKLYFSNDIAGIEIAGAYKNIIAIASGVIKGKNLGINAQAALISRGLVEMTRFAEFFGGNKETFLDIAGAGDLFMSSLSENSRNFRFGLQLGQGLLSEDIVKNLGGISEGVPTTYAVKQIADENNIYCPIAQEVFEVLEGNNINNSIRKLLN